MRTKGRLLSLFLLSVLVLLSSCSKGKGSGDENEWRINSSITAALVSREGYGRVLEVTGSGEIPSLPSEKDAPWYSVSGKVNGIELSSGITGVGDNVFASCVHVSSVVIPETVGSIGGKAFPEGTKLFLKGNLSSVSNAYTYSEENLLDGERHWHYVDGKAEAWPLETVLFIGNSFTYYWDIDQLTAKVAAGAGLNVKAVRIAIGAHNISQFADSADEGGRMVDEALAATSSWDHIVLQEQSTRSLTNFDLFQDGMKSIKKKIDLTQDHAKVYLYSTWGFPKSAGTMTIPEMEGRIRSAYRSVADEMGTGVSKVGEAFTYVYQNYPKINLIHTDQQHPSYAGSFLSACVHAATLFGIDPRTSTFDGYPVPEGSGTFSRETAEILKNVAYETVFKKNK